MAAACKQSASLTRASYGSKDLQRSLSTRPVRRRHLHVKVVRDRVCLVKSVTNLQTQASLEPTSVIAVTQQAVAYAVVLGAEGVYTRTQMAEDATGRPAVLPIAAGIFGTVAAVVLVSGGSADVTGLGVGLVASAGLLAYNVKRFVDTKHDPQFWPGPKAWPGGMALISFFAVNVFLQGLRSDFSF